MQHSGHHYYWRTHEALRSSLLLEDACSTQVIITTGEHMQHSGHHYYWRMHAALRSSLLLEDACNTQVIISPGGCMHKKNSLLQV